MEHLFLGSPSQGASTPRTGANAVMDLESCSLTFVAFGRLARGNASALAADLSPDCGQSRQSTGK